MTQIIIYDDDPQTCDKGAAGVSLAGVLARLAGAHHVGRDVSRPVVAAVVIGEDIDRHFLENVGHASSRRQGAPARHHSYQKRKITEV